ncbi:unnamed protein product [Aphanomyces euteiches]|uniref:Metalloendopeptidase n=1 Tax=Aphanomyces euteiches TaxID=100861 RepID=A0A6G0XB27_9STRA|nr:hypothetical protein Ae201684_006393 [Aphanomyces euteiches]KAH9091017.1 hypothetical protein Ae201684P_006418 [Aphanomyces euteiches]KAH9146448.1 hypothetical protein AeRB84_009708 [Aphanomyces euteiches]
MALKVLAVVALCAFTAAVSDSRSLRSHHDDEPHHHRAHRPHHRAHRPHHRSHPAPVDFSLSCDYDGTTLRNRQTKQLAGKKGHKGSIFAVCLDGKLVCHEEIGVSDTPALPDLNCSDISLRRRLGLIVESPASQTWPQGVVCYKIASNFTQPQKDQIQNAMAHYKSTTNIRFLNIDACPGMTVRGKSLCGDCKNYANINNWDQGCYAGVGYQNVGPQMFNLHPSCFDDMTGTGRVIHEFGHCIGLYHEHSHPLRKIVVIPGELKVSRNNYQVFTTATRMQYDTTSIMHYDTTAGLCLPKDSTVKYCDVSQSPAEDNCVIPTRDVCDDKASQSLGQRIKLSPVDLESITRLYGNTPLSKEEEDAITGATAKPAKESYVVAGQTPTPTTTTSPTMKKERNGFMNFLFEITGWFS